MAPRGRSKVVSQAPQASGTDWSTIAAVNLRRRTDSGGAACSLRRTRRTKGATSAAVGTSAQRKTAPRNDDARNAEMHAMTKTTASTTTTASDLPQGTERDGVRERDESNDREDDAVRPKLRQRLGPPGDDVHAHRRHRRDALSQGEEPARCWRARRGAQRRRRCKYRPPGRSASPHEGPPALSPTPPSALRCTRAVGTSDRRPRGLGRATACRARCSRATSSGGLSPSPPARRESRVRRSSACSSHRH